MKFKYLVAVAMYLFWILFMFIAAMGILTYSRSNAFMPLAMMLAGFIGAALSAWEAEVIIRGKRRH